MGKRSVHLVSVLIALGSVAACSGGAFVSVSPDSGGASGSSSGETSGAASGSGTSGDAASGSGTSGSAGSGSGTTGSSVSGSATTGSTASGSATSGGATSGSATSGGPPPGDAGGIEKCSSSRDCPSDEICGFPRVPLCGTIGECFHVAPVECLVYEAGCACDGTEISIACTGLPAGYDTKPLRHTGACKDGG